LVSLGVLDQSPIRHGSTAVEALGETVRLAQACEAMGYSRYWLAEHHNTSSFAGSTPEILIGKVASETSRIRVGSGGVMMMHYSSLKVAENFRMLETLYPGRIDLGIGRAPGADQRTTAALQAGPEAYGIEVFPQQIELISRLLHDARGDENALPPDHPYQGIHAMPRGPGLPEIWILGSSIMGGAYAGKLGQAFCFAHFINQDGGRKVMETYRERFQPSLDMQAPAASVGVSVLCAETEEEAKKLAMPRNLWVLRLLSGRPGAFPSYEEALSYPYTPDDYKALEAIEARNFVGTPEDVKFRLLALGEEYGVDEFIAVTITHDFDARVRSYELLADAFGLAPSAV
jgi:luciferase family oxidoreductase group 1